MASLQHGKGIRPSNIGGTYVAYGLTRRLAFSIDLLAFKV